jgi:IclR family transcriptional regulator, pca regulon regulatory protein
MTLSEVARRTGLTRAAARRFLHTLETLGYVGSDGRLFSLQPKVLDLGYSYLSSLPLWDVAERHMEVLVDELHESSSASVLDHDEIVYVVRVPTKRIMTIALGVGTRLPAYCTSMGRVLLANLPAADLDAYLDRVDLKPLTARTVTDVIQLRATLAPVAERGWCVVDQELEEGIRSVAAPIRGASGDVLAALNVSAHASRTTLSALKERFLPAVVSAAAAISEDLRRQHRG